MNTICLYLMILATFPKYSNSEYFSSTEELKSLKFNHEKFIELFKEFSNELEKKSFDFKNKLKELEKENEIMLTNIENYVFNPLNAFGLIKRLSHDIEAIQKSSELLWKSSDKFNEVKIDRDELNGAVEGIYRLQETYELKSAHLAKGIIHNKRYRKELPPGDILVLAKEMFNFNENLALEYISVAKEMNEKNNSEEKLKFFIELFDFYNSTARYKDAVEILDNILEIDSDQSKYEEQRMNIELLSLFNDHQEAMTTDMTRDLLGAQYTMLKETLIFSKACRGKLMKPIKELSQLHCRYVSNTYFTKIAPFKIVEANLNPFVAIYLDVISDQEIELLKSFASQDLNRAQVMGNNTKSRVSRVRIAKLNWQQDTKHEIYKKLTKRVHHMTGLNMKYAEQWQVQNYGIGGFYGPHHDYAAPNQQFNGLNGNRIATTLFYLSDVEKGGGTVFPLLRIHVPPKKGTAVFWYNLSTSGDREQLTRHAACPVLVGSKWVANKWIREYGQEFTRPCELIPRTTDENYYLHVYNLKDYGINSVSLN